RSRTISHGDLLRRVIGAANLFHGLLEEREGATIASLGPIVDGMMEALLGAEIAGVASTINYLLTAEVIADLLAAENATVLVLTPPEVDAAIWQKALSVIERTPSLERIVVLGDAGIPGRPVLAFEEALGRQDGDALTFETRSSRDTVCALFHTGG